MGRTYILPRRCSVFLFYGPRIEFPWINIAGNFNFADVLLIGFSLIFTRFMRWHSLSFFPIALGLVGLISMAYNSMFMSSYSEVGLAGFPIVLRWIYYGFIISLFYSYCTRMEDLYLYLCFMVLGVICLLLYSWCVGSLRKNTFTVTQYLLTCGVNALPWLLLAPQYQFSFSSISKVFKFLMFAALFYIIASMISTISKAALTNCKYSSCT